jgi:cytochrome c
MLKSACATSLLASVILMIASAVHAAEPNHGQALFQINCASCHNDQAAALGPSLVGVVGRKAASAPGFRYSGPLRRSGLTWTPETLTAFVTSPQTVVPGTRMPFEGLEARADAEAIVAYLETLPPSSKP